MDNFYTRHTLAMDLSKFTDGDICIIGTVRANTIDRMNLENVKKQFPCLLMNLEITGNWLGLMNPKKQSKKSKKNKGCNQRNTMDAYLISSKR